MPIITEYTDCLAVTYGTPEEAERSDYRFIVPIYLPNGRPTEVTVCARQVRGGFRVTELLLDKDLLPEDVQDLAELEWYVFRKNKPGTRVPPVVRFWEQPDQENVVVACVPCFPREDWQPWGPGKSRAMWPWMDVCPWPKFRAVGEFKKVFDMARSRKAKFVATAFYTFAEYCRKNSAQGVSLPDPGIAYAQYLACLRTFLVVSQITGVPVFLKAGDVGRALSAMKERGLKPEDPSAWDKIESEFEDMPEVLVEEEWTVREPPGDLKAVAAPMGHLGKAGHIDCLVAEFHSGESLVGRIVCWPNPILPPGETLEKARRIILNRLGQFGASARLINDVQPFPGSRERTDQRA